MNFSLHNLRFGFIFRGHLSFTLTVTLTIVSLLLIIFSGKWTHVSGSLKIKTHEGTIYQYERKVMCEYTPWRLDSLLYSACVKKRKRFLAGKLIAVKLYWVLPFACLKYFSIFFLYFLLQQMRIYCNRRKRLEVFLENLRGDIGQIMHCFGKNVV